MNLRPAGTAPGPTRDRALPAAAAVAVLLLAYASWQLTRWGHVARQPLVGDAFFYPAGVAAVWTSWGASRRCRGWRRLRNAWRLLAAASLVYLLGDVAQTAYELAGSKPYPSFADPLYLGFYPLMLAGVLTFPAPRRSRGERLGLAIDLAVVALGGAALVGYVLLGPDAFSGATAVQSAFSVAYPVGDIVLLVGLASLLMRGSAPSARVALQVLSAAIGFYVAADLVYGYVAVHASYRGGDPVDALWMLAVGLTAVAGATQRGVREPEQITRAGESRAWLPYAGVAAGFGVLLFTQRGDSFFPGLALTLTAMVLVALVALRQFLAQGDLIVAQRQLRHQALHDPLTGLPNRILALDRAEQVLARARREHTRVAALFVDVDDFKHVNDTLGHVAGDRLLAAVAARIAGAVRGSDTVARLGGDEFLVVLDAPSLEAGAELVAERILDVTRQPVHLGDRRVTATVSIGVAAGLRPSAEELVRDADIALYRAKETGRNRYVVFELEMSAVAESRATLQMDLHDALGTEQFFLVYQPTFDLRSGRIVGVEALLRWHHPTRGLVPPDVLVPVAEANGLITPLGRWVLNEACRRAGEWRRRGSAVRVAVNVSSRQLDRPEFVDDVREALARGRLEAGALTLEITETALMIDPDAAAARLGDLKSLGVRIAVDDFGTGYSSLNYLSRFPVDAVKIDRSFVSGMASTGEAGALVHTLVQLGKSLGLETLGEGIEEPAQLERLRSEGCDQGQGFLLARPLDPDALEALLELQPLARHAA